MAICFIAIADGLAMLLPGPSSALGGATILVLGLAGLGFGLPRSLSPSGRTSSAILATRFGLLALPALCLPVAGLWLARTPEALTPWFAVAWFTVWSVCLVLSAFLPCPECSRPFGRRGLRLQIASSACAHCGANPRPNAA